MSIESVMLSNHRILCHHLLLFLLSVFPSIKVFSSELALHIRWSKYWSFSNSHNQGWFPLRLTVLMSLQSRDPQESSPALQFENISFLVLSFLYGPAIRSIHDYWKNHSFDCKEGWVLKNWCFQTMVLKKTLESLLDFKEIKPVNPKGTQHWIFIRKAEAPILWSPDWRLKAKGEEGGREWDG